MITAKIDPLIPTEFELSIFNPLVFTGSPDAARSILSAIAAGWTTILGVAFSVTLITLQLSSSKYLATLITEFQNDKINQFALGWFIFVSSYSLLTLKTVITEESNGIFIPILGTNISIAIAIAGLLIFVVYIHNISNYIKPNILISRIVDGIISSFKKYENRQIDKKFVFNRKPLTEVILSIRSPDTGVMSSVDWKKIQDYLLQYPTDMDLWMEWYKSIGDWSNKGEKLAVLYKYSRENYNHFHKNTDKLIESSVGNKNEDGESNNTNNNDKRKDKDNDISLISNQITSAVQVLKDGNLSEDPILGIKLLEQMALKSNNLRDFDVVNSLLTGLFRILIFVYFNEPKLGLPFTPSTKDDKTQKARKISLSKKSSDKNYSTMDNKNENEKTVGLRNDGEGEPKRVDEHEVEDGELGEDQNKRIIIINPRELKIQDVILDVFTNITNMICQQTNNPSNELFCKLYVSTCNYLLENSKINEFETLTEWYSKNLSSIKNKFPGSTLILSSINLLSQFKEDIEFNYPFASKKYSIFMKEIIS